jgi:tetraacyldisaccharide 4'-kinase
LEFDHFCFPDHHLFSKKELNEIKEKSRSKLVLTTEKDYHRLILNWKTPQVYFLPIQMQFLFSEEEQQFKSQILSLI